MFLIGEYGKLVIYELIDIKIFFPLLIITLKYIRIYKLSPFVMVQETKIQMNIQNFLHLSHTEDFFFFFVSIIWGLVVQPGIMTKERNSKNSELKSI